MSAEVRTEIATAAETVTGINCSPYYRQSLRPGDAFVRRGVTERDETGLGFMVTWEVWVALPQDLVAAEKQLDSTIDNLTEALSEVMVVTTLTPSELGLGDNTVPGVVITGAREG